MAAMETYRIEDAAEARGRNEAFMLELSGKVGQLARDVRLIAILLIPIAVTALVLSVVSFVLVLAL